MLFYFREGVASILQSSMNLGGPRFLGFYLLLFGAIVAGGLAFRRALRGPHDEPTPEELELGPYEVAYLAGGGRRAANAAIASLVERQLLGLKPEKHQITRLSEPEETLHPLERGVLDGTATGGWSEVSLLHGFAEPALERILARLVRAGLVVPPVREFLARGVGIGATLTTAIFGLSKLSLALERGRPILFLALLVVASGIAGVVLLGRRLHRTGRGDRALARLRHEHRALEEKALANSGRLTSAEVPLVAGLVGLAALSGVVFDPLKQTLHPPSRTSGGCGGGCGGGGCSAEGGCGGGCGGGSGGCGGCGG
jgi:uncharacterized protein (TIGR04222 family)